MKCGVVSCMPIRQTEIDGTQIAQPTLAFLDKDTYTRVRNGEKEHNIQKWDWSRVREPSSIQRKKLITLSIMMATRTLLYNQSYQFDGRLYKQVKEAPLEMT